MTCSHLQLRVCRNPSAAPHGNHVTLNVCARCPHNDSQPSAEPNAPMPSRVAWRGLGDVIASATKAVGISPCGGCQQRQDALNRLVPFAGGASPAEPPAPSDPPSDLPQT